MSPPTLAIVAAGAMGAAVGRRLTTAGLTVLTDLTGRSPATQKRAADAGLHDATLGEIATQANWVLSILPPSDAYDFAQRFRDAHASAAPTRSLGFADCNAVNPNTVKRIAALFQGTPINFIDAGIIGGPPKDDYNPVFYASANIKDDAVLEEFSSLTQYGLNVKPLRGEGAGIGDASSLKMSYAGITKGMIGLWSTMILSAHAASPATATALMHELADSQPVVLQRIIGSTSSMPGKAYRWVGEMEEISEFVSSGLSNSAEGATGAGEGQIHQGLARLYERMASAVKDSQEAGEEVREVKVLRDFARAAKEATQPKN